MTTDPLPPLLGPGRNSQLNACLNFEPGAWGIYATGYRRAAEILTSYVAQKHQYQDLLIYPVLFLWRHHLELQLKALTRSASRLLGRHWSPPKHHELPQLFGETRRLLREVYAWAGERAPSGDLERIRTVLAHFRAVDPESIVFRYPEDLAGRPSLPEVRYINYENVATFFTELASLLDAADAALQVFLDWQQEVLASYPLEPQYPDG